MRYAYRDVFDFQNRHPTRATREEALETMSVKEIMHIARSCATAEGRAYYARYAEQAAYDDLLSRAAAEARTSWREAKSA